MRTWILGVCLSQPFLGIGLAPGSLQWEMGTLQQFLKDAGLQDFAGALEGLGVQTVKDLEELEPEDYEEIGMKKLQKRRLERHLGMLESDAKRPRVEIQQAAPAIPVAPVTTVPVASVATVATPVVNSMDETKEPQEMKEVPCTSSAVEDGEWEMPSSDDELMQHVNSLGEQDVVDIDMDMKQLQLALTSDGETMGAQLIGLQTDLQDDMHVAKMVTNIEEIVALCNMLQPKSAAMVPKLKVNFEKLSQPSSCFQVLALLGEKQEICKFLETLEVTQKTSAILNKPGLYALVHQQRLYLILWPAASFRDHAHRRQLISFIHFVLQLSTDVVWLVQQSDLDGVQTAGNSLTAADTSRNMDIQISMKSASEDDCTLSSHFQASLKSSAAAIRVFSGKHCASLGTMQVQPAGRHSRTETDTETILNFFRDIKDTHIVHFGAELKLEDCAEFLKAVAPEKFRDVEERHDLAKADALQDHLARSNAIDERAQSQKEQIFFQLKEVIKEEFLQNHPWEFFALTASDAECAICSVELDASPCACLPCDRTHVFHRDCLKQCLESCGECPKCPTCRHEFPNRPVQDLILDLVDKSAAEELRKQLPTQPTLHVLAGRWNTIKQRSWMGTLNYLDIFEDRGKLAIRLSMRETSSMPVGCLREGIGKGEGYWYADLKYPNSRPFGTVRLKQLGNDEVDIFYRSYAYLPWNGPDTVAKDPQKAWRAEGFSLDGAIKHTKLKLKALSIMYVFSKLAWSKKLLRSEMDWADTTRQMLIESVQNPNAFNEWHRKLAPPSSRLLAFGGGNDMADMGKLKKLIQEEIGKGVLKEPHYTRTLQTYKDQLLLMLDESIRQMSDQMFSRLEQQLTCRKKAELDKDWKDTMSQLERSRRDAYSLEMQNLAPPNAMSLTLTKMLSRYSGNYRLSYDKEVEGSPKLCCTLQHLRVEKQLFEQALAGDHEFQIELDTFAGSHFFLDVQDPTDVHVLGSLAQDRLFLDLLL